MGGQTAERTETALRLEAAGLAHGLRERRRGLGLTQQELADLAGVSTRFVHDLENAKPTVQLDRVLAVAHALGLDLRWQLRSPGANESS